MKEFSIMAQIEFCVEAKNDEQAKERAEEYLDSLAAVGKTKRYWPVEHQVTDIHVGEQ